MSPERSKDLNDFIQAIIDSDDPVDVLQNDRTFTFWVDWREFPDEVISAVERRLSTGKLSAQIVETAGKQSLHIEFGSKSKELPLTDEADELLVVVSTLNEMLVPDFEIRFGTDLDGDGWLYMPLATREWLELEDRYGQALSDHFEKLADAFAPQGVLPVAFAARDIAAGEIIKARDYNIRHGVAAESVPKDVLRDLMALEGSTAGVNIQKGSAIRRSDLARLSSGSAKSAPPVDGIASLQKRAESGDKDAMLKLANEYTNGIDVERDLGQAFHWNKRLADAGSPIGMSRVAQAYDTGDGVTMDEVEAARWYRQAAEYGDAKCMTKLAEYYEYGKGRLGRDLEAALNYYLKAKDRGVHREAAIRRVQSALGKGDADQ